MFQRAPCADIAALRGLSQSDRGRIIVGNGKIVDQQTGESQQRWCMATGTGAAKPGFGRCQIAVCEATAAIKFTQAKHRFRIAGLGGFRQQLGARS